MQHFKIGLWQSHAQANIALIHRVLAAWVDKRYLVEGNMGRMTDCKSTDVRWTEPSQFWLPTFFVVDVLEMVSRTFSYGYFGCKKILYREGTCMSQKSLGQQATDYYGMMSRMVRFGWPCFLMVRSIAQWTLPSIHSTPKCASLSCMAPEMQALR